MTKDKWFTVLINPSNVAIRYSKNGIMPQKYFYKLSLFDTRIYHLLHHLNGVSI